MIIYLFLAPANRSSTDADGKPEGIQVQERRRVLIIYSLDHPLYKNIVLKLCAFLMAKCGTEVVLDLLDSARLGEMGSIQWLDWHREQVERSSDKILILCSRGVQAKWRAMCGENRVILREDDHSSIGDMLSLALSLIVPHFVRSASFQKYIVAFFEDICSEDDVPLPFNITVRYKLMRDFEELFFRILDVEKHEPGRVNRIEGLAEDKYFHCSSGRALRDAIKAFCIYQQEHPQWFEDELVQDSVLETDETSVEINDTAKSTKNFITHFVPESTSHCGDFPPTVISQVKICLSDFNVYSPTLNMAEQLQIPSFNEFSPIGVDEKTQLHVLHPVGHDGLCVLRDGISPMLEENVHCPLR